MNRHNGYDEEYKPFDLHNFINRFLRRRHLFLYVAVPIFLISIINQVTRPYSPIYRATFDIGVSRPVEGFFSDAAQTPTLQIGAATQRVISSLLSVKLAEKVADNLSLSAQVKNGQSDIRLDVKVKETFKKPIGPLKLKFNNGRFTVSKNGKKLGEGDYSRFWIFDDEANVERGVSDEYVDLGDFELKVIPLREIPDGKTYELTVYPKDKTALALRNSLTINVLEVDNIEQESGSSGIPHSGEKASKKLVIAKAIFPRMDLIGILRIGVHWGNPSDALKIAEILSEQIIKEDRSEKSLQFSQSKTFIDSQLTFYQKKLNVLEDDIRGFKEQNKITDLRASTQALIGQVSNLESRKSQLEIEQKVLTDLGQYLAANNEEDVEDLHLAAVLVSDPVLQDFYSKVLESEAELRVRLKEYSSGHPKVIEIIAQLDGLKEQMREEVKKRRSTLNAEITSVARQIRTLQSRLEDIPEDEVKLARLGRDRETAEKLYTFFAEKLEETRVKEAGVTSDLRIINPPIVSSGPVNSRQSLKSVMVALVLGIFAGSVAVLIAEYVDNTIKDPETVGARLGLPIFASIPIIDTMESDGKKKTLLERLGLKTVIDNVRSVGNIRAFEGSLKALNGDISSPEFEAFRKLSVSLDSFHSHRRMRPRKSYRVIYVTSPGPGDGKTFIALNLGIALGSKGKLVVIVDTDFRKKKGHLTDAIRLKREVGLFDVLRGQVKLMDAIVEFRHKSSQQTVLRSIYTTEESSFSSDKAYLSNTLIDFMPIGDIPSNPFLYLESEKMSEIIEVLKGTYDYVIIDGVPVLLFADATYIADLADGVLLAARYAKTRLKELENAKDILIAAKLSDIGIVINGVPKSRGSYYYDYYYKHYSKYYKKG